MPRAIWSGAISFGLVNIPVKLYSAVSSKTVRFNQIDSKTNSRVKMKRVASADESREVPHSDIVKGYELSPGNYVTIEPTELEALDPKAVRSIDICEFVEQAEIDPIFYDHPYQIAPAPGAAKAYMLLVDAMAESGKVAIARFVMRSKQYLAAVRVSDGRLIMSTMHFADEIVEEPDVGYDELEGVEVTDAERKMATQLIESLSTTFEPEQFRDTYREKVLDLIEQKAAGETVITAKADEEPTKVVDLMAALEASVAEAKKARTKESAATG